jgi:tetratricopeptide (TPR) repeat protein
MRIRWLLCGLGLIGLAGWTWPGTVARLRNEAGDRYQAGDYEAAEQGYARLEQMADGMAEVSYNRGNALYRLERYEEAIQAYQRAQKLDKAGRWSQRGHYNRGNALFRLNRLEEAEQSYQAAIDAARAAGVRDEDAEYNLALVRQLLRDPPRSSSDVTSQDRSGESGPQEGGTSTTPGTPAAGTDESDPGQDRTRKTKRDEEDRRSSRHRRKPEYGLTEQEVDRLLKQLEADERQLQQYFNRRPRSGPKRTQPLDLSRLSPDELEQPGREGGNEAGEPGGEAGRKDW